jgi:hypothetical protein
VIRDPVAAASLSGELPVADNAPLSPHPEDDPAYQVFIDSL